MLQTTTAPTRIAGAGDANTGEIMRFEWGLKYHSVERTKDGYFSGSMRRPISRCAIWNVPIRATLTFGRQWGHVACA